MDRLGVLGVTLLGLMSAFAGCSSPNGEAKTTDPIITPSVNEETGGILGTILAEDGLPIEGAQAGIKQLPDEGARISNSLGKLEFSNILPGEYRIDVVRIGYDAGSRTVTVVAGEVATFDLTLIQTEAIVPYADPREHSARVYVSVGYTIADCTLAKTNPLFGGLDCNSRSATPANDPNYENIFAWEVNDTKENPVQTIIAEAKWNNQNTACRSTFLFDTIAPGFSNDPNQNNYIGDGVKADEPRQFEATSNTSPISIRIERSAMAERGLVDDAKGESKISSHDDTYWFTRVFADTKGTTGAPAAADVGCSQDQPFTVYFTVFYGDPAPEGYTRTADA